jgi:hypothetical protein
MPLEPSLAMRGFSTAFIGFLLLLSTAAPAKEKCHAELNGWTETEYRDVMTGRYGVDREPVFVADCD